MREKPVSPERIEKYVEFINTVRMNSQHSNPHNIVSLSEIASNNAVSSAAPAALIKLGYVDRKSKTTWFWKTDSPLREIALKVLDYLLHKNKKTIHVPIPEFAGIADTLTTIAERLAQLVVQNEKYNRGAKNSIKQAEAETDLFRVDDQELYIAGQVASGYLSEFSDIRFNDVENSAELINKMTIAIMNKLRNK